MKVDVRGEICPYPMMKAIEAMKKAKGDEVIEVLTDHPPALETIPPQAQRLGWAVEVHQSGAEWRLVLTRKK